MSGAALEASGADREERGAGLFAASPWPAECGGARRQKSAPGGFGLGPGDRLRATARDTGRWNVMVVTRRPGQLFLQGNSVLGDPDPHGFVERIDPLTLAPLAASPRLRSGGHTWCGAALVHRDGDVIVVNGSFAHRLDAECRVQAERALDVDAPHNGIVALSDGRLATKDLRLDRTVSTLTVLEPEGLEVVASLQLPEPSMGRIAAEAVAGEDLIVVPGREHLLLVRYADGQLELDDRWRPRYRRDGGTQGMAWDPCLAGGAVWLHDDGDVDLVRAIHAAHPAGSAPLSAAPVATWTGAQRLVRVNARDSSRVDAIAVCDRAPGWVIAPPVHVPEHGITVAFDTANGVVVGVGDDGGGLRRVWTARVTCWMQPLVFPDTGELVVDDFGSRGDELVVLDLASGRELGRVALRSPAPNGMFLAPGSASDVLYCSNPVIARVWAEAA